MKFGYFNAVNEPGRGVDGISGESNGFPPGVIVVVIFGVP